MAFVKKGSSGTVSYQRKRRPRSTLLVSKIPRLARTAQGSRQEGWKLGETVEKDLKAGVGS
jgi:hypothetical protein